MTLDLSFIWKLMSAPTERDKQVKVGASNLGNPCTRCLADDLLATTGSGKSKFWLASWLGTAAHERMAETMPNGWLKERRVELFSLPGYGSIKSTTDLYLPEQRAVVDYKTTTRAKLKQYKRVLVQDDKSESLIPSRYTLDRYLNQTLLYGLGIENQGLPVDWVALLFLCRDGTGDNDIWPYHWPYDRELALRVYDRAARLWAYLQEGGSLDDLNKAEGCYYCLNLRGLEGNRTTLEREEIDL